MKVQVTKDVTAIVRRLSIICDRLARDQLIVRFTRHHSRGAILPQRFSLMSFLHSSMSRRN
jgi:hypothetical protein